MVVQAASKLPRDFDVCDPRFGHDLLLWALQTRSEISELVAATEAMIDASKVLIATTDRVIAWRV